MPGSERRRTAGQWAADLAVQELPVLNETVQRLCHVTADRETSAADLTGVVLADASMASGVLRLANSAFYRSGGQEIGTVSRAVVMLGFEAVRGIGLSLAVIDQLLQGGSRERVVALMNQAVLAAVQARAIARRRGDPAPEEVFIAALLYRVGAMAFWSLATQTARDQLGEALTDPAITPEAAEREVLGTSLQELTARLAREWQLGAVLRAALRPGRADDPRAAAVRLGHRLEAALRRDGLDGAGYRDAVDAVCRLTGAADADESEALLASAREEAREAREALGIPGSAAQRPEPRAQRDRVADPALQLRILRDMSGTVRERRDPGLLLEMGVEGVYRGIAMDRAAVMVLSRDRSRLELRHSLGDDGTLRSLFPLGLADAGTGLFRRALADAEVLWRSQLAGGDLSAPERCAEDFLITAIRVRGRPIGLLYADRGARLPGLDADCRDAFAHFAEQISLGIEHLLHSH